MWKRNPNLMSLVLGSMILCGGGWIAGCGNANAVLGALGIRSDEITLTLVNDTQFDVEPSVYISAVRIEDAGFEELGEGLVSLGVNRQPFSDMPPGANVTQTYQCDDFRAVMANNAELQTGLGISPDGDSDVFLRGEDFECGDEITIRYSGGIGGFQARISTTPFLANALIDAAGGR